MLDQYLNLTSSTRFHFGSRESDGSRAKLSGTCFGVHTPAAKTMLFSELLVIPSLRTGEVQILKRKVLLESGVLTS